MKSGRAVCFAPRPTREGSINMTIDDASRQAASAQGSLLVRYPLTSFFVMAFAFSWIVWSPWVLSEDGAGLLPFQLPDWTINFLLLPAGILLGPTLSGFIMTGITEGREGIRRLLHRIVLWRVGFRWYLFALIGIPLVMALGTLILPEGLSSLLGLGPWYVLSYVSSFVLVTILGGPLFEEPGWRGFALPRLQPLHGPLVGTIILGILWACWHLPLFWSGVWTPPTIATIIMFILMITCLTIIMTWVFNHAKGSLLITMLMHASFNTFANRIEAPLFPAPILNEYVLLPMLVGFWVVAVVLIGLTRGRLGYQHYHPEETAQTTASA